jgi:hypothetical protein
MPIGVDFTTPLPVPEPVTVSVKVTAVMVVDGSVISAVSRHAYRSSRASPSVRASAGHEADRMDGDIVVTWPSAGASGSVLGPPTLGR